MATQRRNRDLPARANPEPTLFDAPSRRTRKRKAAKEQPVAVAPAPPVTASPLPAPESSEPPAAVLGGYARKRADTARRTRQQSEDDREIGPIPPVVDPERRAFALASTENFARTYLGHIFRRPFAPRHQAAMRRIDEVASVGGRFALGMPRADGKTQIGTAAMLRAACLGSRRFILTIAGTMPLADKIREGVKREFEGNVALAEDFPEICYPIHRLEHIAQRGKGQTLNGQPTHVQWSASRLVLPTVPGSPSSGVVFETAPITGAIRGLSFKRPDNTVVRPDFVLIDDPQTEESARSKTQVNDRLDLVNGAIAELGSFDQPVGMVALVTVIEEDDLADQLLDRQKSPEWRGEKYPLLEAFPTNLELWREYAALRVAELQAGGDGTVAPNQFYLAHREEMDLGARVGWEHRYGPREISAIQHAMTKWLSNPAAFAAEMQLQPLRAANVDASAISSEDLYRRQNGSPRGVVPAFATRLTAFIDVGEEFLAWTVCAWGSGFSGAIVDCGTWPEQPRGVWTKSNLRSTLSTLYPSISQEAAWWKGFDELAERLLRSSWVRTSGDRHTVDLCLIDESMGKSQQTVRTWAYRNRVLRVMPSKGIYMGASATPMDQWKLRPGEERGRNWIRRRDTNLQLLPTLQVATNAWKTFVADRLRAPMNSDSALTIFGDPAVDPSAVRMVCDHLTAEYSVRVTARGVTQDEWRSKVGRDNEIWDGVVGCAVAADVLGVRLDVGGATNEQPTRRSMSELQRRRRGR